MRVPLLGRAVLVLCGIVLFSFALAVLLLDRTLAADLRKAARQRLEASSVAVVRLVQLHVNALHGRYAAIAGTPQLRATLGLGDPPTLAHYARTLREHQGSALILFLDRNREPLAADGNYRGVSAVRDVTRSALRVHDGTPLVIATIPVQSGGTLLGYLIAAEQVGDATLREWSELSGASVSFGSEPPSSADGLVDEAMRLSGSSLWVSSSLAREAAALARSRWHLLGASLVALLVALGTSFVLSGRLVGVVRQIKDAAIRIGAGELDIRIPVLRRDELGELAVSVNEMALHLDEQQRIVRDQHAELRDLNTELLVSKERAEAASRAKSDFLANMSHEIRTPLTAILGFTDVLIEDAKPDALPPEQLGELETIRRNGRHLLELVNDILDLSKIEEECLEVESVAFSPSDLVDEVTQLMRVRAEAKGVALEVERGAQLPAFLSGDPTRIRQILINLVGNAIKFTDEGRVLLRVNASETELRLEVEDTGVGIGQDELSRLFKPFTQVDSSRTRRFGGTGLGLALSKRLAELMGGRIEVDSELGRGSRFRLVLPTALGNRAPALPGPRLPPPGSAQRLPSPCRILLAEDGPDNQRLIRRVLERAGADVEVAGNGRVAADRARAAEAEGAPFDVILMDLQMPELDGYTATRRLRESGYGGPIIALTAHAMAGERERCLEGGFDAFETKPIDRPRLISSISGVLGA